MMYSMSTRQSVIILLILIAALVILSSLFGIFRLTPIAQQTQTAERMPAPQAQLTKSRTIEAIGTKQFSRIISLTDTGFESVSAQIAVGDTVRFFNNSTHPMRITSTYPTVSKKCDARWFDSCKELPPGEYFDFTFTKAGQWNYSDTVSKHTAMIGVN